jgi:hypothetical protein
MKIAFLYINLKNYAFIQSITDASVGSMSEEKLLFLVLRLGIFEFHDTSILHPF